MANIKTPREVLKLIYEGAMAIFSLLIASIILLEFSLQLSQEVLYNFNIIDNIIWGIFTADYIIRFFLAKGKFKFIRSNIIELIAIIPFNSIFQAFRLARLIPLARLTRAVRMITFIMMFYKKTERFFKTNNFHFILCITIIIILAGTIGIHYTEDMPFGDALWWSFVTSTTVGYGDISPKTPAGRIIAVVLMIVGIGFLGMLTGTISTYFLNKKENKPNLRDEIIENVKSKLNDLNSLSDTEFNDMLHVLSTLRRNKNS